MGLLGKVILGMWGARSSYSFELEGKAQSQMSYSIYISGKSLKPLETAYSPCVWPGEKASK